MGIFGNFGNYGSYGKIGKIGKIGRDGDEEGQAESCTPNHLNGIFLFFFKKSSKTSVSVVTVVPLACAVSQLEASVFMTHDCCLIY